ncbi:hypothetical protein TWF569_008245 [Orbilia oligospora]|uniref:Uncharacterized protein n=1 Tax=Orbilia oligospora TaxID=2813651 RepID=A0A7C8IZP3_ORBOL|nr:hypothetical protein TWF103_003435 [Orbilia oligospora]KAF3082110.1 hypothetical protein TWF706_001939 [Orbilia oligospora]KAF3084563.1 hypothetical protein TWF102_011871 [Orbilia oligospora]KAF3123342.1 hypothetical protein TWF594_002459 [Orbilia oligospora]KAF3140490.1 hypothetical protein TWF569_008245 [Orbilia oligospora]
MIPPKHASLTGPSIKACLCPVSRRQAPWACAVMLTANLFDFQIQLQTQLAVLHDITYRRLDWTRLEGTHLATIFNAKLCATALFQLKVGHRSPLARETSEEKKEKDNGQPPLSSRSCRARPGADI